MEELSYAELPLGQSQNQTGRNKSCPKFCLVIACGDTPMQNQVSLYRLQLKRSFNSEAAPKQNHRAKLCPPKGGSYCYALTRALLELELHAKRVQTRGGRASAQLQNSNSVRVRASPLVLFRRCRGNSSFARVMTEPTALVVALTKSKILFVRLL